MDPKKEETALQHAPDFYIYLGKNSIFGLCLNHLLSSKVKVKLEKVFTTSHDVSMNSLDGIFVMDSKLHCLAGVRNFPSKKKVIRFRLPTFDPEYSAPFESYKMESRPILFTTSKKVYALETNPKPLFSVFDPEIGKWKSLPSPGTILCLPTLIEFQNNILLQTHTRNFIFDVNLEVWNPTDKLFPKIWAALEYQDFTFVLSVKPFEVVVYDSASFGEKDCFFRVLDIWKGCFDFSKIQIHWASLSLIGNNFICLVFISMYKVHIAVIRFMKTFIFANLEAYQEHDLPRSMRSSDIPFSSTFFWGLDVTNLPVRDEIPAVTQHHIKAEADQIEENSMDHKQADDRIKGNSVDHNKADQIEENSVDHNKDRYLYIYLGFGALLSLNFSQLCKNNKSSLDPKLDLQLVFSHHNKGTDFPIGMGLFIQDSVVNFFGGEDLEDSDDIIDYQDLKFSDFSSFVGLKTTVRPRYGKDWYERAFNLGDESSLNFFELSKKKPELSNEWFNKKVYSFNLPNFTKHDTRPPDHSGCKFRPLVFTISNKFYALSTRTISIRLSGFEQVDDDKLKLFEVFEPEKNEWRHLKKLPSGLSKEILDNTLKFESHCVFRDKMLLQTSTRDYVFDSVKEDWLGDEMWYPRIYSALEYNEEVLLVLARYPVQLLVYESASFGEKYPTFGKLHIDKVELDFAEHHIYGASLNLVDNNHISLVLITAKNILVYVFKIEAPFIYAAVVARGIFDVPRNCFFNIKPCSTFFMCKNVDQHDDDTEVAGPSEGNLAVSQQDMLERNKWRLFKEHLNKWAGNSDLPDFCPSWSDLMSMDPELERYMEEEEL